MALLDDIIDSVYSELNKEGKFYTKSRDSISIENKEEQLSLYKISFKSTKQYNFDFIFKIALKEEERFLLKNRIKYFINFNYISNSYITRSPVYKKNRYFNYEIDYKSKYFKKVQDLYNSIKESADKYYQLKADQDSNFISNILQKDCISKELKRDLKLGKLIKKDI